MFYFSNNPLIITINTSKDNLSLNASIKYILNIIFYLFQYREIRYILIFPEKVSLR